MEISAEEAKQEFGLTDEEIAELSKTEEVKEEIEASPPIEPPKPSKYEAEALEAGWVPEDEWVKQGKDPEDWRPAKAFIEVNKLHKSVDEKLTKLERKHEEDIRNLNKFHELQLLDTIKRLTAARDNAVETGDVEAFKAIDAQLEQVKNVQPAQKPNEKPIAIQEWEAQNKWCQDPLDERTILANALFKATKDINPNMSINDRLKYVDENLALKFPKTNPRRDLPASTESSRKAPNKATYSMSDLTHEERIQWEKFGKSFYEGNEKEFIKSAIAARIK